ncbi:Hsp20 family protein [Nocardia cyriacigeorgica]|uniref:Hsp20 family protein n=1 Tax=Nocardia cyriacigeorgica TaxID=135487 RepID=UPI002458534A|nr:Hsp20 family protein [Nocardia cyriacigeorgica]
MRDQQLADVAWPGRGQETQLRAGQRPRVIDHPFQGLARGADEKGIEATYAKGILSVSVPMGEPKETPKVVEVKVTD